MNRKFVFPQFAHWYSIKACTPDLKAIKQAHETYRHSPGISLCGIRLDVGREPSG